ncbi:MAG: 30S ribosomal protein S8, partial [Proteobacteria bacterium]|nr:30S ribosomal protein S8 [Pseudomonadota bacterium]
MSMTDPLGDMLTRIRNGLRAKKDLVSAPASRNRQRVLEVLEREGYIRGFEYVDLGSGKAELKIMLKYYEGDPVIQSISRISSHRSGELRPTSSNGIFMIADLGVSLVSTLNSSSLVRNASCSSIRAIGKITSTFVSFLYANSTTSTPLTDLMIQLSPSGTGLPEKKPFSRIGI